MTGIEFFEALQEHLSLPFEVEDVVNMESNCGSVYIDLKNGKSCYISIDFCEEQD